MEITNMIETLKNDIQISNNPKSHLRNSKAMGFLMAARELWTIPGRQATAILLQKEAMKILADMGNY